MNLLWTEIAWTDYLYWQTNDKKILKQVNRIIQETKRNPFHGIGQPEPLKHELAGCWSRRIDDTNRLVYSISENVMTIYQCRTHYGSK